MNNLLPVFASSSDPTQVSTTVQGIIVGASAIIIALAASVFHLTLSANDVISLGTGLGMIAGAVVFILGLAKKGINKFGRVR